MRSRPKQNYYCYDARSNTRYVHHMVTPYAAWQLNHMLRPHRGIKGVWRPHYWVVGF